MKTFEKRTNGIIANLKKKITQTKTANNRRFGGVEPKTSDKENWMNGRWEMKMSQIQKTNQLPVPTQSKFSLKLSTVLIKHKRNEASHSSTNFHISTGFTLF